MQADNAATERVEQARRVWQIADRCRLEAAEFRGRATQLDKEAGRLDSLAAAIQDGRSIEEGLRV